LKPTATIKNRYAVEEFCHAPLAAPRVAFVLTVLPEADTEYETHSRRLLRQMDLEAILWANISLKKEEKAKRAQSRRGRREKRLGTTDGYGL